MARLLVHRAYRLAFCHQLQQPLPNNKGYTRLARKCNMPRLLKSLKQHVTVTGQETPHRLQQSTLSREV